MNVPLPLPFCLLLLWVHGRGSDYPGRPDYYMLWFTCDASDLDWHLHNHCYLPVGRVSGAECGVLLRRFLYAKGF